MQLAETNCDLNCWVTFQAPNTKETTLNQRKFREIDLKPPLSIQSLFEVGHVAYFSPIRHTSKQKLNFFLLQYSVTF